MGEFKTESDQERGEAVRENLKEQDEEVGFSGHAGGLDVFSFFLGQHGAAYDARVRRDGAEAEGNIERSKAPAGRSDERNG